ncbi:MAG: hypothetical protein OEZ34_01890 [Spirochaetia bacterium]|nr:hypothetical protein [Spirochaetia bacterium]
MKFVEEKKELYFENEKRSSFLYEGIIIVSWKRGVDITEEDAKDTMLYAVDHYMPGGKLMPTMVDLTLINSMTRESREYFQNTNTSTSTALALVVSSTLSRVIGNIFLSMNQSGIPLKLFNTRDQALEWLRNYP